MQTVGRKIKIDGTLKELFLSFLLNGKYQVPPLNLDQEKLISHISEWFFMSGFILKSCDFKLSHSSLVEKIKYQRKLQLLKQMSVKNDLNNIALSLNEKCIQHAILKGVALNADGIYSSGIRFSRDIDLLVRLDQLNEAYDVLKMLGFRYLNPKTKDSTKYHYYGHHLPVMINENNTQVELHWRVTAQLDFKNCPLTDNILSNRRISNTNPHIFCPKIEMTLAHLVYHSFRQHRMNLGPTFLFDLAAIFVFFKKKWIIDIKLHKKLKVEKNFDLCRKFIEITSNESTFSFASNLMADRIFNQSHWLRIPDNSKISGSSVLTAPVEVFKKRELPLKLLSKVRSIRTSYQISYYSAKFWLFLISEILTVLKRGGR